MLIKETPYQGHNPNYVFMNDKGTPFYSTLFLQCSFLLFIYQTCAGLKGAEPEFAMKGLESLIYKDQRHIFKDQRLIPDLKKITRSKR